MISFSLILEIYKYPEYKLQPAQSIQYYLDALCPRADELVLDSHGGGMGHSLGKSISGSQLSLVAHRSLSRVAPS